MIEIGLNKVNKNFGFNKLLTDISFEIKSNDRVALVGSNGCGKTTTLKMIKGEIEPDTGNIFIRKGATIGYLSQIPEVTSENELANEVYLKGIKYILNLEKKIEEYTNTMDSTEKSIKELSIMQEEFRIKGGYEIQSKIEDPLSEKILEGTIKNGDTVNCTFADGEFKFN